MDFAVKNREILLSLSDDSLVAFVGLLSNYLDAFKKGEEQSKKMYKLHPTKGTERHWQYYRNSVSAVTKMLSDIKQTLDSLDKGAKDGPGNG